MAGVTLSTAYLGQGLVATALILSLMASLTKKNSYPFLMSSFVCVLGAFLLLVTAHLSSDFSYLNVVIHSHTQEPFLYKLAGVWGSHEGSFLLWVLLFSLYSVLLSFKNGGAVASRVMACLQSSFLLLLILACDPFSVMASVPANGLDLNPSLQDLSLLYHPPCLYAGLVGCAVPFALCFQALVLKKQPQKSVIIWVRVAWTFLTAGLLLGSYWAYYELGWGGFWFWDPVENAALMPWLVMTALIHTIHEPSLRKTSLALGLLGFCLCICILFFVRSGMLVSVHSFAVDVNRGWLFGILMISILSISLAVFIKNNKTSQPLSKLWSPSIFLFKCQIVLLMVGVFTLFLSIIAPVVMGCFGMPFSLKPSYFKATFLPALTPLLFFMAFAPFLTTFTGLLRQPIPLMVLLASFVASWVLGHIYPLDFFAFLGLWLAGGVLGVSLFALTKEKTRIPMHLCHGGLALVFLGAILGTYGEKSVTFLVEGGTVHFLDYTFRPISSLNYRGSNYEAQQFPVDVLKGQKNCGQLVPELRYYPVQDVKHHESALLNMVFSQLYAICVVDDFGKAHIKISHKPYINLLWLGAIFMILGGSLACLRVQNRRNKNLA
jgi:cytochrome c-type biogenesis protein CcmF